MLFRNAESKYHIHSLQAMMAKSLFSPKERSVFGKASFCASDTGRGSMTVECALVLFLFFAVMVTVISFMDLYQVQVQRQSQLRERVEQMGVLDTLWESGTEEVELPDLYLWNPPVSFIPLSPVILSETVRVHAWTGYSGDEGEQRGEQEMVYITQTGSVYHLDPGCSYLTLSIENVSQSELSMRRNESGGKYYPCEKCIRSGQEPSSVYITGSGDRYHSQITCSGLKRTVRMVEKSQLKGWRACSRCG